MLILLLIATACDFSHVKPGQTVVISGRALSATGAPLRNVTVHLYKEADFGEFLVGSALTLGSLGGVCLFRGAPAICHRGNTTTTTADGSYRFTIKGSDTQGLVGTAATLDVVFADPKGGAKPASTALRFTVQKATVRLPAAQLWRANLHVLVARARRPGFGAGWTALPGKYGADPSYGLQFLDPSQGLPLWSQTASGTHAVVDARILEDHAADVAVTARAALTDGVHAVYQSARVLRRPIAGVPPSRHQPCSAVTGTKRLSMFKQTVCVATDGNLESPSRLVATNGKVVTGVVVDLGRVRRVGLVVGRGLAGSVVVELSSNGTSYHRVAVSDTSTIAARPAGRPVARYVRVRSASGLDESMLAELSVWS
jgi:hypothetical protein